MIIAYAQTSSAIIIDYSYANHLKTANLVPKSEEDNSNAGQLGRQ